MGANLRPAWGKMWDRFKKKEKKKKGRKCYNWQPPEYFIFMTFTYQRKWAWDALTFQVSNFLKIRQPSTMSTHFHLFFWTGSLQKLLSMINFCKCIIAVWFYQRLREYDFPKHSPIKPLLPEVSSLPSAVPCPILPCRHTHTFLNEASIRKKLVPLWTLQNSLLGCYCTEWMNHNGLITDVLPLLTEFLKTGTVYCSAENVQIRLRTSNSIFERSSWRRCRLTFFKRP